MLWGSTSILQGKLFSLLEVCSYWFRCYLCSLPFIQENVFFHFEGADLHAVALCCLLQVVAATPEKLAEIFHEKLDWIKVCFETTSYK